MDRALGRKPKVEGEEVTKLKQALKDYDKYTAISTFMPCQHTNM